MGAQVLEPFPQARRVEPATVRKLHDVLVADQNVGMLGHRTQGRLGGPGPALGRGQVAPAQNAVHPELQEGSGLCHGPGQRGRVAAGEVARIAPLGEVGHDHVDFVLALPLVDAGGRTLARSVGVVGQHNAAAEVPQQGEMLLGQGRPAGGHGPGHAGLEEADDVGVALAHHHLALPR